MTPAGTSNELDVQNQWEENTHTHTHATVRCGEGHVVRDGVHKYNSPHTVSIRYGTIWNDSLRYGAARGKRWRSHNLVIG